MPISARRLFDPEVIIDATERIPEWFKINKAATIAHIQWLKNEYHDVNLTSLQYGGYDRRYDSYGRRSLTT